ncbi:MAG: hypothetical protein QOI13_178 [Paraburkholderia sp.]|nr:hypothetical protein [Paraburkholderia sp.]
MITFNGAVDLDALWILFESNAHSDIIADIITDVARKRVLPHSTDFHGVFQMLMRTVSAEHGTQWIANAWALFRLRPAVWIALGAIDLAVTVVLACLPLAGESTSVFTVLWTGGMTAAAQACATTGIVSIADVVNGIRDKFRPLFVVALVALLASLVCDFAGSQMSEEFHTLISAAPATGAAGTPWLSALIYAIAALGGAMALWLAPSLIVLYDTAPGAALKASLLAIWRNPWPTLVYGALVAGLLVAALVTLGIALLIVAPLVYLSTYAASRDLFIKEP